MPKGTGVSSGVALAPALLWQAPVAYDYIPRKCSAPSAEVDRFEAARRALLSKTSDLRQRTARLVGAGEAAIFDAYKMILDDEEGLLEPVRMKIRREHYSAEYAVTTQFNELAHQFLQLEDEYMRQRVDDVYALRDQLMRQLRGEGPGEAVLNRPTVLVAHSLSPSDIATLDLSRLEGIVCETGGYSSHMSIIARTLGIPAVVGVPEVCAQVASGNVVALDGDSGEVWVAPNPEEVRMLRHRAEALDARAAEAQLYRGRPTITTDGHRVELSAVVGQLDEVDAVTASDAEALGLFRTELLHLAQDTLPTENDQFRTYCDMLEKLGGKAATVRIFDNGANSNHSPLQSNKEERNPALGYRGIRMALGRPSFFRCQLRALLRASAYGNLRIVFPMISTVDELDESLLALERIKEELHREGIPYNESLPVGVYIEVPAAALMADALAQRADFLVIGINGLIQFTLAVDRDNPQLSGLYHVYHPALLRLVHQTVDAAHRHGIPCTVCGEAPGQERVLPMLLGMGVDGFAISPRMVLRHRQLLSGYAYNQCQLLANHILQLSSPAEVAQRLSTLQL